MESKNIVIRTLKEEDFDDLHKLWMQISGFAIRSIDDSKEGVKRFIRRNPATSVAAIEGGKIIGAILCGHDGRRACLYHVCVHETYRKQGIGQQMVKACLNALEEEKITKVNLIAFCKNEVGNAFWNELGWKIREDVNYYECVLDGNNRTEYNP